MQLQVQDSLRGRNVLRSLTLHSGLCLLWSFSPTNSGPSLMLALARQPPCMCSETVTTCCPGSSSCRQCSGAPDLCFPSMRRAAPPSCAPRSHRCLQTQLAQPPASWRSSLWHKRSHCTTLSPRWGQRGFVSASCVWDRAESTPSALLAQSGGPSWSGLPADSGTLQEGGYLVLGGMHTKQGPDPECLILKGALNLEQAVLQSFGGTWEQRCHAPCWTDFPFCNYPAFCLHTAKDRQ